MKVQLLLAEITKRVRKDGFWTTLYKGVRHLTRRQAEDSFDRKHGTDTGGYISLWQLTIDSPNARFGIDYLGTNDQELIQTITFLHEDLRDFTFVDLGCGKGRALLAAATCGFKQVVGVEFAHELVQIARNNLVKMGISNAVVLHSDVCDYRFPDGDMVVYLYNPFSDEILKRVIANLRKSASKIYVIYTVPLGAALLDASGFVSRLGSSPAGEHTQIWRTGGMVSME